MAERTNVNYDHLRDIVKKFNNEGESIAQILAKLRESVHHMQSEWIGAGSDAFFDEMEMVVLPAVQRLCDALLLSGKTLTDISKLYEHAEDEGKGIFKGDLHNLANSDFGAGRFGGIGSAIGGMFTGVPSSEPNLGSTDFGAGQFEGVSGAGENNGGTVGSGGPDLSQTDFGASQFVEGGAGAPGANAGPDLGQTDFGASQFGESGSAGAAGFEQENPVPEVETSGLDSGPAGAGGGGSAGSESGGGGGASGNLDSMGSGLKDAGSGGSSGGGGGGTAGSGGEPSIPDHVYQSAGGGSGSMPSGTQAPGAGAGNEPASPEGDSGGNMNSAGIAGVVAGAGAAAGGAAKIIKDKKDEE